ncbi:MAG: SET domain-containing protein-lysine N-methyltransferase [Acidobacteria bacterium]|nr:SET domain-containing protein-lysine N-methyltransferase [Acidobacteriota bacterium]
MKLNLAPGLTIGKSPINGRGCFASHFFLQGYKIAEYAGERISRREVARRVRTRRKLRICALNPYWSLDGSLGGNGTHYINHSCAPNSYMKIHHGHILFMALRDINPGDEITCDYISSYHSDAKKCRCRSPICRGTINKIV